MLSKTMIRVARQNGLHTILTRGEHGSRELSSMRLILDSGDGAAFQSPEEEAVLVLQAGAAVLEANGEAWEVSRESVFKEPATALYVPRGVRVSVSAHEPLEAIIIAAPVEEGASPFLMRPERVKVNQRGAANYAREVHDIFVNDAHAKRLLVGETFNPPGNWSSYPPHKHDGRDGEPRLEEVYHYRVYPPQGYGLQSIYTAEGETVTFMVRDGDAVVIPFGYHPVAAPPGYSLYYLWALVGEQRKLTVHDDPQHSWIVQS